MNNMKLIRQKAGVSAAKVAKIMGVTDDTVYNYENEKYPVPEAPLQLFAFAINASPSVLLKKLDNNSISRFAEELKKYVLDKEYNIPGSNVIMTSESSPFYGEEQHSVGATVEAILKKHHTDKKQYAEKSLRIPPKQLDKIIKNEITPDFWVIAKIAEDHAESLDLFRSSPLPKGHLLSALQDKERIIEAKDKLIEIMQEHSGSAQ